MTFKYLLNKMKSNWAELSEIKVNRTKANTISSYFFPSCLSSFSFAMAFTLSFAITTATPLFFSIALSISTPQIALAETSALSDTSSSTSSQNSSSQNTKNIEVPPMDTTHWITYPVGRYLIDLPPTAKLYWHPLRFRGEFDLVWKKDLTMKQARELLIKEAEEAKKAPHKTEESQLIRLQTEFGLGNRGIILIRRPHEFAETYLIKTYFPPMGFLDENLNKTEQRVFYYEEEVLDVGDMPDKAIQFFNYMKSNVMSTYPTYPTQPISANPGTYFEGGVLDGPWSDVPYPTHEEIGIEVTFAEFPGIQFTINFDHLNKDTDSIFRHINSYDPGIIRKAKTTIDGNPADEVLGKFTENGITHYSFSLNGPSKEDPNPTKRVPIIIMHLKNPTTGVMRNGVDTTPPPIKRPSFKNDEEAIAVWDAIRRNIRWRPDQWRVESTQRNQHYIVGGKIIPYMLPMYKGKPQ